MNEKKYDGRAPSHPGDPDLDYTPEERKRVLEALNRWIKMPKMIAGKVIIAGTNEFDVMTGNDFKTFWNETKPNYQKGT